MAKDQLHPANTSSPVESLPRKATLAVFWNVSFYPLTAGFTFALSILLVRSLNVEQYGFYVLLISWVGSLLFLTDLGIVRSLARFFPEIEKVNGKPGVRRFFWQVFGIRITFLLLVVTAWLVAPNLIAKFTNLSGDAGTLLLLGVAAVLFIQNIGDMLDGVMYSYLERRYSNFLSLFRNLSRPLFIVFFIYLGWGAAGIVWGLILSELIRASIAIWPVKQLLRGDVSHPVYPQRGLWKDFLQYNSMSFVGKLSNFIWSSSLSIVILSLYLGEIQIAIFGLAIEFTYRFLTFLFSPLMGIEVPLFANIKSQLNNHAFQMSYAALCKLRIVLFVPSAVFLALSASRLITLLYPDTYSSAIRVAQILIIFLFVKAIPIHEAATLLTFGRYKEVLLLNFLPLMLVPILLLVASRRNLELYALTLGIGAWGFGLFNIFLTKRTLAARFPFGFLAKVAMLSTLSGLFVLVILTVLPLEGLVSLVVYLPALALLAVLFKWTGGFGPEIRAFISQQSFPFKRIICWFV